MRKYLEIMPFRSCAVCGRLLFEYRWICATCEDLMRKRSSLYHRRYLNFEGERVRISHSYLWEWSPSEDNRLLYQWIKSIKGVGPTICFEPWVRLLAKLIVQQEIFRVSNRTPLFIPCPASKAGARDHAARLCEALSHYMACKKLHLLYREEGRAEQKFQNRKARQKLKLLSWLGPELKAQVHQFHLCFIDDILTTGSTAQAAWKALGRPPHFSILSLIYRSHLREEEEIDILQQ